MRKERQIHTVAHMHIIVCTRTLTLAMNSDGKKFKILFCRCVGRHLINVKNTYNNNNNFATIRMRSTQQQVYTHKNAIITRENSDISSALSNTPPIKPKIYARIYARIKRKFFNN